MSANLKRYRKLASGQVGWEARFTSWKNFTRNVVGGRRHSLGPSERTASLSSCISSIPPCSSVSVTAFCCREDRLLPERRMQIDGHFYCSPSPEIFTPTSARAIQRIYQRTLSVILSAVRIPFELQLTGKSHSMFIVLNKWRNFKNKDDIFHFQKRLCGCLSYRIMLFHGFQDGTLPGRVGFRHPNARMRRRLCLR